MKCLVFIFHDRWRIIEITDIDYQKHFDRFIGNWIIKYFSIIAITCDSLRNNNEAGKTVNTGSLNGTSGSCNERPSAPSVAAVSSGESHHSTGMALGTMATPGVNPGGHGESWWPRSRCRLYVFFDLVIFFFS